jgi:hypothetical protein
VSQRLIYRCSPSIVWVNDAEQTLVVDKETKQSWVLRGTEAVVWDLLAVGYSYQRIVPMLSLILSLSVEEAEHTLTGVLRKWQDASIIRVAGGTDGGELGYQCSM